MRNLKENKNRRLAAFLSFFLVISLLATDLPELIQAQVAQVTEEQVQEDGEEPVNADETGEDVQEPVQENKEELPGEVPDSTEDKADSQEEDKQEATQDEPVSDTAKEEIEPNIENVPELKDKSSLLGEANLLADAADSEITATDVAPVDENDPMYWMGQKEGGDTNRAMVWFGDYWQTPGSDKKTPVMWRTLRSDGEGNYGGCVTLLQEDLFYPYYYSAGNSNGKEAGGALWAWPGQSSHGARVYLNGYGTDAMMPSLPPRRNYPWSVAGGAPGDKNGCFFLNSFNNWERSFLVRVRYYEPGLDSYNQWAGETVDAINIPTLEDVQSSLYFGDAADRMAYGTNGQNNAAGWWIRGVYNDKNWHIDSIMVAPTGETAGQWTYQEHYSRALLNLDPRTITYTAASTKGRAPKIQLTAGGAVLEASTGIKAGTRERDATEENCYSQGASYRIFERINQDSGLGISASAGNKVKITYPPGAAGQYISVMAVEPDTGMKWVGRVKEITDNTSGDVDVLIPQRISDGAVSRSLKIFAWRETEETKSALAPNYVNLDLQETEAFTLSYADGGGTDGVTFIEDQMVVKGANTDIRSCTFKKKDWYFKCWQDQDGNEYAEGEEITPTKDMTLTAVWVTDMVNVTYTAGKGSGSNYTLKIAKNSIYTIEDCSFTPPSEGEFIKWTDKSGNSYFPGDKIKAETDLTLTAQYGRKGKITYKANGGVENDIVETVSLDDPVTLKNSGFTRPGYTLIGFGTTAGDSTPEYSLGQTVNFDESTTLYAKWEAAKYTIKFDANGATQGSPPDELKPSYGDTATLPSVSLLKTGKIFDGWNTNKDDPTSGNAYQNGATINIDNNFPSGITTLYAMWKDADNYKVTYDLNKPAGVPDADISGTIAAVDDSCYNDGLNIQTTVSKPGVTIKAYKFMGWSKNQLSLPLDPALIAPDTALSVTEDITLHAVWAPAVQWTVTYDGPTSGVTGALPTDNGLYYDDDIDYTITVQANTQTRPGWTFLGWSTDSDATEADADYAAGKTFIITGDVTLHAVWEKNSYQIAFDGNGKEQGDVPASIDASYGDTVTVPSSNLLKTGFVFDGWSKTTGGTVDYAAGSTITINDSFVNPLTLYAHWTAAGTVKLSYDKNAGTDTVTGTLPSDKSYYKDGISNVLNVTSIVPVRKGYSFDGWSTSAGGDVEYAPGAPITLTADTTLYAKWTAGNFSLTYHFNGGSDPMYGDLPGIVTGTPATTGITVAAQGNLRREKYKFTGWKDADGNSYTIGNDITLTDNIDLYAQWQSVPEATLTYNANCANPETVVPSAEGGHYDDGMHDEATVASDIPIRRGYIFHGWSTSSTALPTDPDLLKGGDTLTVTSNTTLYAVWELGVYTLEYDKNVAASDPNQVQGAWPDEVTGSITSPIASHSGTGLTRAHYTFKEWNSAADGTGTVYTPGGDIYLAQDLTLYAIWEPESYAIQYDANGAAGTPPASQPGKYGTTFVAAQPDNLSNPGKSFVGWKDGSGNDYTAGMPYPFEKNLKLYAQWADESWVIQFNTASADQGGPVTNITAGLNAVVRLPQGTGLKKSKYVFNGWNTAPDGTSGTGYPAGGSFTIQQSTPKTTILYASWKKADAYKVAYHKNGKPGSNISGDEPPQVTCYNDGIKGSTVIPDHDMVYKGYRFMGWSETSGDGGAVQYHTGDTIDAAAEGRDIDLYAVWSRESFQLIYDKTDSNAVGPVPDPVTGSVEDTDIEAAEQGSMYLAKHKFIGWNTEPDYSGTKIKPGDQITLDENKVLYAEWIPVPLLSVTYYGGCGTPAEDLAVKPTLPEDDGEYYEDGISGKAEISTIKPVRFGYEFAYWTTKPLGQGTRYNGGETVTMKEDLDLYAVWTMGTYRLTYHAGEAPSGSGLPPVKYGTILSGIEVASGGSLMYPYHTFIGWNTQLDGTGTSYQSGQTIALGRDTILYAQWRETEYKVKFDLNSPVISQAQGTVPDPISGTYDETFTAPDPADFECRKYKFTGWNTDPDGEGEQFNKGEEYTFDIFENYGEEVTLYANWVSVPPYEVHYNKGKGDVTGDVPVDNHEYIPDNGTNFATVLGPGNLKRKGYEFDYWTTKPDGSGIRYAEGSVFVVTAHTVLYAQWRPGTYTLTYDKNGSSVTGKAPNKVTSSSQEDITAAGQNTMKRKNYEFLGWAKKASAKSPDYKKGQKFRILENTTVYAVWRKLINVSIEETEGLRPVTNGNISVSQGTKLSDLDLPEVKSGYEIEGWIVNGQKVTNPKDYVLNEDAEVQAIVKKKPAEDKKDPSDNSSKDDNKNKDKNNKPDPGKDSTNDGNSGDDFNPGGNSTGGSPNSGGNASGNNGGSYPAASGNSTKSYRTGKMTKSEGSTKKTTVQKPDETDPSSSKNQTTDALSASGNAGNTAPTLAKGYTKEPQNCRIHWLLALGALISTLYFILRRRYVRKNRLLNMSKAFDIIIPILAAPLIILGWSRGECRYDVYVMIAWGVITLAGMFLLRNAYKKNLENVQDQVAVLESVTADNKLR